MADKETHISTVAELASKCFSQVNSKEFHDNLTLLKEIISSLKAEDLNFDSNIVSEKLFNQRAPVIYIPICKTPQFTMSIFVIRRGGRVPLHDHPDMYGICKVINGSVHLKSYTELNVQSNNSASIEDPSQFAKPVTVCEDRVINETDNCVQFTPTEGNFHEIRPVGEMAAFLDLLAPPYNDEERQCRYYKLVENEHSDKQLQDISTPLDYCSTRMAYTGPSLS